MTEQKMGQINSWIQQVNQNKLDVQDKLAIAGATMEMLEKLEPVYDKYNGSDSEPEQKQPVRWWKEKR